MIKVNSETFVEFNDLNSPLALKQAFSSNSIQTEKLLTFRQK